MTDERRRRYRIVEMTPDEMKLAGYEGETPFYAVIQSSLTLLEIDEITDARTFGEVFQAMAPFVVEWNAKGMVITQPEPDPENERDQAATSKALPPPVKSWELVPPPAEAGWEVFKAIEPEFHLYLRRKLIQVSAGGEDLKNVRREPEFTVALSSDESSDSPPPQKTKTSRKRQQA